jgi:hypothetical protein
MNEENAGAQEAKRPPNPGTRLAGTAPARRRGKRVDRETAAARHSSLTADTPSDETAWDRIAELLIELALEHDPAILEPVRPRAPTR